MLPAVTVLSLALCSAAAAQPATFMGLGAPPGAMASSAEAVDATGSVIVGVIDQRWPPGGGRPARWRDGEGWELLPLPVSHFYGPAVGASPTGVIASGAVVSGVAQFFDGTHSSPQPTGIAIWDGAGVSLPEVGYLVSAGASDCGSLAWSQPFLGGPFRGLARVMVDGLVTTLPHLDPAYERSSALAISRDGRTVVGWSTTGFGAEPCRWVDVGGVSEVQPLRSAGEPLRTAFSRPSAAVSPDGQWIALRIDVGGRSGAPALWHDGVLEWLAPASEDLWELTAVSDDGGMITGVLDPIPAGRDEPWIWDRRAGVEAPAERYLESRHRSLDGWTITRVADMTPDGRTLIGTGTNAAGAEEGWIATLGDSCYADCDGSGGLDFFDFLCFQNEFAAGAPGADCDVSGQLDFLDFLCFQNQFAAGCP